MKKNWALLCCVLFMVAAILGMGGCIAHSYQHQSIAYADEIEELPVEEEEVEYPCKVIIAEASYGDVLADIEGGEIGDICTLIAKPYVLCSIKSIQVNGVDLTVTEEGYYQFALVEGENVITAEFKIDQEQVAAMMAIYEQTKEKGLASLFTMENLLALIGYAISILMGSGFLITWLKTKTIKSATAKNIEDVVVTCLSTSNTDALNKFLKEIFGPSFDKISESLKSTQEICRVLARCMVLAQEDTPEARLAIIKELTNLNEGDKDLAAQVKAIIAEQQAEQQAAEKQKADAIAELEAANEKISAEIAVDNKANEVETGDYGQF